MKNILLIGCGQVGNAIKQVEEEAGNTVYICELNCRAPTKIPYDVAYVNIRYSETFIKTVMDYCTEYNIKLLVINSTVPVGTTKILDEFVTSYLVHSPVSGIHPYLYNGVKTFIKFVGGTDKKSTKLALEHFKSIGLKTKAMNSSDETEYCKLTCTSYYGYNIFWAKMINEDCKKLGLDYKNVYTLMNNNYNKGYKKLGKKNVIRPVLFPPEGPIGGHCVLPNIELLPEGKMKKILKELNDDSF